ncbi:MAG: hypothetical protein AB8B64_25170 [Granulosicoccus sp.]
MMKYISEVHEVQAANEQSYNPFLVSEVPDDWSHTINVTSDYPAMNRRHNDSDESLGTNNSVSKAA